jgi:hypothetical protein
LRWAFFMLQCGGRLMGIAAFLDVNYWLHELKT